MKFPSLNDLDREQKRVYGQAPNDGAILVVGPPGTGKTVMAMHRAMKCQQLGQKPAVIMFNRVLRQYSSAWSGIEKNIEITTMLTWLNGWWRGGRMGRLPKVSQWVVDWEELLDRVMALEPGSEKLAALNWGHLIIDEGQDFPEEMYFCLGRILKHFKRCGASAQLTVFADDNQRLQADNNCTVKNIAANLGISRDENRLFFLSKNHRNTLEVARFARYFQVGKTSGASKLPSKSGEVPSVDFFENDRSLSDFVARKLKISIGKQVGVIVNGSQKDVKRVKNQLETRLKGSNWKTQFYTSKEWKTVDELDFASPNTLTVLHQASAKGLEFDIVFYVGLERVDMDGSGGMNERMAAYVMASRAREELRISLTALDMDAGAPDGVKLLPRPGLQLCRFEGFDGQKTKVAPFLEKVDWREPEEGSPFWTEVA